MINIIESLSFLNDNVRYQAIFILLLRSEDYYTSERLANELDVTSRTIKSDIKNIKDRLQEIDLDIVSVPSKGYHLSIDDEVLKDKLKTHYRIFHPDQLNDDFSQRVEYILKKLLTSNTSVTVSELQDEMFISRSYKLTKELNDVKKILRSYGLILKSRPHYGLEVSGENYKKLMLIIRLYRFFDNTKIENMGPQEYDQLFIIPKKDEELLRKIVFNRLLVSDVVLSDIYVERLIVYFVFLLNNVFDFEFDKSIVEYNYDYTITREYKLISNIIEEIQKTDLRLGNKREAIHFLTLVTIMSTDLYYFRDCTEENYGHLIQGSTNLIDKMQTNFSEWLGIEIKSDYTADKDLVKIFIPIALKIDLKISDDADFGFFNTNFSESNPTIYQYIIKLKKEFEQEYKYTLSNRELSLIYDVLFGFFNRIIIPHKKMKLAIIAVNGRLSTQQLKFNIKRHYMDYIEKIDTKSLYDFEHHNQDYDYYLVNEYGKHMNIRFSPIYYAQDSLKEMEYVESLSRVFVESYDYKKYLPNIKTKEYSSLELYEEELLKHRKKKHNYEMIMNEEKELKVLINLNEQHDDFTLHHYKNETFFGVISSRRSSDTMKIKSFLTLSDSLTKLRLDHVENMKNIEYADIIFEDNFKKKISLLRSL